MLQLTDIFNLVNIRSRYTYTQSHLMFLITTWLHFYNFFQPTLQLQIHAQNTPRQPGKKVIKSVENYPRGLKPTAKMWGDFRRRSEHVLINLTSAFVLFLLFCIQSSSGISSKSNTKPKSHFEYPICIFATFWICGNEGEWISFSSIWNKNKDFPCYCYCSL